MSYRGMGDYRHMGDGFLGSLVGVVKSAAKGFALGGPLGAIAGARAGLPAKKSSVAPIGSSTVGTVHHTHSAAIDTFLRTGGRFSAAGKAKLSQEKLLAAGVHPALAAHVGGGGRRRMNWANPRALGRAERRISSALHHFTKFFRWAHPGKSAGHAVPKFHKRKK